MPTTSYTPSVVSDDFNDYDIISNGGRSLESSIDDLGHVGVTPVVIREPAPTEATKERLKTVSLSAEDIQGYVRRALEGSGNGRLVSESERKRVTVYVDGLFDGFSAGHALQFRQAKLAFPMVHLMVGVFADDLCQLYSSPTTLPQLERCEVVRHCRWVDEVVEDAPWVITEHFLQQRGIDVVALDEGTSVDPACDRVRLRGYDHLKSLGKIIPTRRTSGLTALVNVRPVATPQVYHSPIPVVERDEDHEVPEPSIDIFGIGI
ncbi:hypothetical protein JAAARDRAFT_31167 [Jaapia argillacea MUCL 33604]|uniref:choline-phosphate cytidylyltransferase n=1 Tax=Jaapia argillacea MUCL 33604 TaxID=933084 RepID=A0A067QGG7_9AGAM|nr:hypothetical protein JAAARDRAFT_31167 [Jaapia argillacea MUCL 33604]